MTSEQAELLNNLPILARLDDDGRQELRRWLRIIPVEVGDVVYRQGERGGALLWVLQGIVRLEVSDHAGRNHTICSALPGEVIGELTYGELCTRATTAIAASALILAELTDSDLQLIERRAPRVASQVLACLTTCNVRRLRHINRELDQFVGRHLAPPPRPLGAETSEPSSLARLWSRLAGRAPGQEPERK
ncbi:MAG: cyclic nucleotide-binding domain-containing protein [Deltaproteobacteria bacterium]|nr:cyclic nucleotide-binding domain-containing protein [Deltaproteobacteria bacterium]